MESTTETKFKNNIFGTANNLGVGSSEYDKAMKEAKKPKPRYTGTKTVVSANDIADQPVRSEEVTPYTFDLNNEEDLQAWKDLCKEKGSAQFKRFSYLERKYCEATGNWKIYVEVAELILIDSKKNIQRSQ